MGAGGIIVQPQWLVSGTRVAGSYKCLRQAVLEERCGGSPSDKATLGTLLHDLLQVWASAACPRLSIKSP